MVRGRTTAPARRAAWRPAGGLRALALAAACAAAPAAQALQPGDPPLGTSAGASRQAWATAAALSRGIGVAAFDAGSGAPVPARVCDVVAKAGFRSVRLAVPDPEKDGAPLRTQPLDGIVDHCLSQGLVVVLGLRPREGAADDARRAFTASWRRLARHYAGWPSRLLFELSFAPGAAASSKNPQLADALAAVRASNPHRVVVVGWMDAIDLPKLRLPADAHLIVGVANEEPYRFTRQGAPGIPQADAWRGTGCCSPQEGQLMALPLDVAKTWSNENRYPVWLGEFMSQRDIPPHLRARHARQMRQAAEERGLSWAYGDFDAGFGAYDQAAGAWHAPLLEALLGP